MAFINGIWIFVDTEDYAEDMESSTHPVESGIPFTDTVKKAPAEISLSGNIVDYEVGGVTHKAYDVLAKIEALKNAGTLIEYRGRRHEWDMQITSFSTGHPKEVVGGATFSMTLKKCKIVKNSYVDKNGGKQQVDKGDNNKIFYVVKKGDCVAALVAEPKAPYKTLKREGAKSGYWGACNWVMEKNPKAFSRKGDFRTLQIGKTLFLGVR